MILSKQNLTNIPDSEVIITPHQRLFTLPEKVLQFGTGVLLRGLPDYFIDKANKQGIFNGRIVVVKSTSTGGTRAFAEQDSLYTICVRGVQGESKIEENVINASISRVLSAKSQWNEILQCAGNPTMEIIISNTTEIGISLVKDNIDAVPPESFPGKLLAFLYRRYQVFNGDRQKGMVIIPTELIVDNGDKLKTIVLELAKQNNLESTFFDWLSNDNHFCNSLVDRIVPGKLSAEHQKKMEIELGYQDDLLIMCEAYRLWAIEVKDTGVPGVLSFSQADDGVVLAGDIGIYRELKLRLLNGSHTFGCGLAHLCGFTTVREAMNNKYFSGYLTSLMVQEIIPAIASDQISPHLANEFADKVLDRYRNPHLEHQWLSISLQYTSKMRMRNVPVLSNYYQQFGSVPELMAFGFAAFLVFMKAKKDEDGKFKGNTLGQDYIISDDSIFLITEQRNRCATTKAFVESVLADKGLWGTDLSKLPGFADNVTSAINLLETEGATDALKKIMSRQAAAKS